MALIPSAVKPNPQLTDEQWQGAKKDDMARGHEALGLIAMARKKYDDAAAEFKTATETASEPQPATFIRLGGAYTSAGKPDEAIAVLDKVLAMPNLPAQFKQVAQSEKDRAEKAKTAKNSSDRTDHCATSILGQLCRRDPRCGRFQERYAGQPGDSRNGHWACVSRPGAVPARPDAQIQNP